MNLSQINLNLGKKWLIPGIAGLVIIFLVGSFLTSYYKYQTSGPISENHVSAYNEESFANLHTSLIKDKPKHTEQREFLSEVVQQNHRRRNAVSASAGSEVLYTKGSFDTLAVNCGVLLEKYKELVIKYHELEKQVKGNSRKRVTSNKRTGTPGRATVRKTNGNFDYTRYVRSNASSELHNESGTRGFSNAKYSWTTLSLKSSQKIFDQSVVTFDVVEQFDLEDRTIPQLAKIEGVAQVSRGRGRIFIKFNTIYTQGETITIEGEAFSLGRSRGINVYIHGESSIARSLKREAGDLVGLIDPSRTQIGRSMIQDTDVGLEVYATLDAGTMILAKVRRR